MNGTESTPTPTPTTDGATTPSSATPPPTILVTTSASADGVTSAWNTRIGDFASAVGKSASDITAALVPLVGEAGDDALSVLSDNTAVTDDDLKGVLVGGTVNIPLGVFRKHLPKLRGPVAVVSAPATPGATTAMAQSLVMLPNVPDEGSFMQMLMVGGVLKVAVTEVISAVKAGLADRSSFYKLPELILKRMEIFAVAQDEPFGEGFYRMQKLLTEKKYGDILSVLGVPGTYVSEARKGAFFQRLNTYLWSSLASFNSQLNAWQQSWMQGMANPAMMMMAVTAGHGGVMPPGMMAPPDTAVLRTAGEEVINDINRIFAGPGIPVARALAYDATRIVGILNDASLPPQLGYSNREQMIKELGVVIGADIVRAEQSVARYALAIMELPKIPADSELAYLAAMFQLGAQIPWDKLTGPASSLSGGIGEGIDLPPNRRPGGGVVRRPVSVNG